MSCIFTHRIRSTSAQVIHTVSVGCELYMKLRELACRCTEVCSTVGHLQPVHSLCDCPPMQALKSVVLYVLLAPYDNEQSDLKHRIYEEKQLEQLPLYQ